MRATLPILLLAVLAVTLPAVGTVAEDLDLPTPERGGETKVIAKPHALLMGEETEIEVSAFLPKNATDVKMFVQHGSIRDIDVSRKGKVFAIYEPPEVFMPRVDVVAVRVETDDGPLWGHANVQLVGQGEALIKTRPFADATITIGKRTYGPVKANKKGKAKIQVIVPPGTRTGVDGEDREVDLQVPPVERTAIFAGAVEIGRDSPEPIDVYAVIFASDGTGVEDEPLLKVDRGTLGPLESLNHGGFRSNYTPPADGEGLVALEAGIESDNDVPAATLEIELVPEAVDDGGISLRNDDEPEEEEPEEEEPEEEEPEEEEKSVPWLNAALKAGFAWNLGDMKTFDVAADFHVALPMGNHRLSIGAELAFSRASEDVSGNVSTTSAKLSSVLWLVPITGVITYRFVIDERWAIPLFVQLGAILVDNEVKVNPAGSPARTDHELGYQFGVGGGVALEFLIGSGAIFFEAKCLGAIGSVETVDGSLSTLYLNLGYRLFFL